MFHVCRHLATIGMRRMIGHDAGAPLMLSGQIKKHRCRTFMQISNKAFISLILLICLSGCSRSHQQATTSHITGTLTYGEPVTLANGSVLELRLTDVSVSDGPALEIATTTVDDIRALPYQYSLGYDASKIDPQHRYTIDARILSNGVPRYSTDTAYEVLTQGRGAQRDITVVANGGNSAIAATIAAGTGAAAAQEQIFQNEVRAGADISLYRAGLLDGHIVWLEEDRSNGTPQPLHARYEFKGALVMHYADSTSLEVKFDERGRPVSVNKNQQPLKLDTQTEAISTIRNRAALLRSHALAASEARAHREATGG
jgi:putative lipoprotein